MKLALVIANYSIDNSPSILNLISLITRKTTLEIFLFNVSYFNSLKRFSNLTVYNNPDVSLIKEQKKSSDYLNIISIDPHGFYYCKSMFPDAKPVYYSLELYLKNDHSGLDYPIEISNFERASINSISALIIQSEEKADFFIQDYNLNKDIPRYYLPVAYEGAGIETKSDFLRKKYNIDAGKKIALHLGGIDEYFSCIEIIREFGKLKNWVLFFQGYPNQKYLNKILDILQKENIDNVIISDAIYNNFEDTYNILASSDIGIAWYNDISIGFRLAGYSSGKISAYLKFGLPIISKRYKSTIDRIEKKEVGVCLNNIEEIPEAVKNILSNYGRYRANALREFNELYCFDNYIPSLEQLFFPVLKSISPENLAPQDYWDKSYMNFQFYRADVNDPIRTWIEKYSGYLKGGSCIEIGAFPGRYLSIFGEKGFKLNGIDLTNGIIKELPEWLTENGFIVEDFIKDDFLKYRFSRTFDLVCSFGFIEHFPNWQNVLLRHLDLVSENGFLVIETPNFAGPLQKFMHSVFDKKNIERHNLEAMDPDSWKRILQLNDFEIIFSGYFGKFDFWVDVEKRSDAENNYLKVIDVLTPLLKNIQEDDRAYSPYCGIIARKKAKTELNKNLLVPNQFSEKFEINNWEISQFILDKLIPVVGVKPFPLNELMLMVGSVLRIRPTHIFEWGTNIGVSARVFYETIKYFHINCEIHTIDLPDEIEHIEHPGANRGRLVLGLDSVQMHLGDGIDKSFEIINNIAGEKKFLFFLDGDHSYESVSRELSMIDSSIENPNILLHDTFFQSAESNYNIGPYKAIHDYLGNTQNDYKVIKENTGLPGMTLLYQSLSKKNITGENKSSSLKECVNEKQLIGRSNLKYTSKEKFLDILHTVEFYAPHLGGAELVVQQLSERLAKRGHSVTVATSRIAERNFNEFNGVNIEEFDISGSLGGGITGKDIKKYQEFLLTNPADVMMNYAAQQWGTDLVFTVIDKLIYNRVNIIAACGYSALQDAKTIRWQQFEQYFNVFIPRVIPAYDAAIYHSSKYQDYEFAVNNGFKNSIVIPNGVAGEEFENKPVINFREKYNIKSKYIGLCVANYYKNKGHDRIIEALRGLNRNDFTVVFIGKEGEELDNLRRMSKNLNVILLDNISREDTIAAYYQSDLFLFGSHIEAFPLVILEAMASKTPFISTNCGNVKELKGGIVCDEKEIAANINKLLDNESLRKKLAAEGYKECKEKYTWEAVTDKYENLYQRLYHKKFAEGTHSRIKIIQSQIEKEYSSVYPYLNAAKLLISRNKPEEAQKYLEDALELDYKNTEAEHLLNLNSI